MMKTELLPWTPRKAFIDKNTSVLFFFNLTLYHSTVEEQGVFWIPYIFVFCGKVSVSKIFDKKVMLRVVPLKHADIYIYPVYAMQCFSEILSHKGLYHGAAVYADLSRTEDSLTCFQLWNYVKHLTCEPTQTRESANEELVLDMKSVLWKKLHSFF